MANEYQDEFMLSLVRAFCQAPEMRMLRNPLRADGSIMEGLKYEEGRRRKLESGRTALGPPYHTQARQRHTARM